MGWLILVFACVVRIPQVWKVFRAKNAEGLNPSTTEVELIGYSICVMNGMSRKLPVDTWGENIVHSTCTFLMLLMTYSYPGSVKVSKKRKALVWGGLGALIVGFFTVLPRQIIFRLYDIQNLMFIGARIPQIRMNYKRQGTGQLHVLTRGALFVGNLMRIWTSTQKGGVAATAMLFGHGTSMLLNGTIFGQVLYYWNSKTSL